MIKTFADKETKRLFEGHSPRSFRAFKAQAERKLHMLNEATDISDLRCPPGNRLERLQGDRQGEWSIRINDQWHVCFKWESGDASDVKIEDYH